MALADGRGLTGVVGRRRARGTSDRLRDDGCDVGQHPDAMRSDGYPRRVVAWYAVFVLMLCYTLSYADRQILAFLVGPLKHDLHISDTEVGLLQGIAFALVYTVFGLPMG